MSDNIFEMATRGKLRFQYKGFVSTEDLWDLNPHQLNEVFKNIQAAQAKLAGASLLNDLSPEQKELALMEEIVRHIFQVKMEEKERREQEATERQRKARIKEILARKGEEALNNLSEEELRKMLEE